MKLTDDNITLSMMTNPVNLQKLVLDDVSSRLTGNKVIVDPNQVSMLLIEMASNLTSNLARATEDSLSEWLAKRATTHEDLYRHMSDYDYIGLFSLPSSTKITVHIDKTYITSRALDYNNNYKLVVIPETTVFKLGTLDFGIYYPINIRINKHTGYISAVWDTSKEHPLHTLNTNLINVDEFSYLGVELVQLTIPVHQFTRTIHEDPIVPATGYAKKIPYTDNFYGARFYTNQVGSSELVELHQELGRDTYDPTRPTMRMQILLDENQLSTNLPQVYVNNGKVGSKIVSEIYTTLGDITPSLVNLDISQLSVNFNLTKTSSKYAKILENIPTFVISVAEEKASGGSDGYNFEELRERVVYNSFHNTALITPIDLENYFEDKGFKVVKYKDDLTNLIYFAYKILEDGNGSIVPAANIDVILTDSICKSDEYSYIKKSENGSYTILPKSIYKLTPDLLACKPITDTELKELYELSKEEQVKLFNEIKYTKSPFHYRLTTTGRYPYVSSYNLMDPKVSSFKFLLENDTMTAQMTLASASIKHIDYGTGGYVIRLMCQQSQDLYAIPEQHIKVYFYTLSSYGTYVGQEATNVTYGNGLAVYDVKLDTTYSINSEHQIEFSSLRANLETYGHYVDLNQTWYVAFMVDKDYFTDAVTTASQYEGIPISYHDTYAVMIKQQFDVNLGYALDDVIYNSINITWTSSEPKLHDIDVPLTYTSDVYKTDERTGLPVYTVTNNGLQFERLHKAGDIVYGDDGKQLYKYRKGEVVRDANNNIIYTSTRATQYNIQALMLDAKLYFSDHPDVIAYRDNITSMLETHFEVIRTATNNLLERDKVYFKPLRTLGYGEFDLGSGVTSTQPLELTVKFKVYLDNEAYSNTELQETIKEEIIYLIEEDLSNDRISLTEIANKCKENIVHVEAINVLGINGNIELQTLTIIDESVQPSLKQELYLTQDNEINIRKAVDIEWVLATTIG